MERGSSPSFLLGRFRLIFRLPELRKDNTIKVVAPLLPGVVGILENRVLVHNYEIRSKELIKLPVG